MSSDFRFEDLFERGVQNPYPFYHRLRETAPVHWSSGIVKAWFVSRYDDVAAVAEDHRRFASRGVIESAVQQEQDGCYWHTMSEGVIFADGMDHERARSLLDESFHRQHVATMRERIQQLVDSLLESVRGAGTMDVLADFAEPICYSAIREFVGASDQNVSTLKRWAIAIHGAVDPLGGAAEAAAGEKACRELTTYFRDLMGDRRKCPTDALLGELVMAERNGGLTEKEVLGNLTLIVAGADNVVNLIANAVLALLRHPDQLDLLKRNPELIGNAVEECLRYDSLVLGFTRVATEDVTVGNQLVRKGQFVFPLYRSANRDPARFRDPDQLDIRRLDIAHFTFGHGVHHCIGASLARLVGQVAISSLVQRLDGLQLAKDRLEYRQHLILRALRALPVNFHIES